MSTMQNATANEPGWKANPEEYDLVILGGGTGGTIAAWTFAGQGQRVAVIERKYVGGSCQNIDRKSTRLNSSHANISYAVFCLKKKKIKLKDTTNKSGRYIRLYYNII